MHRFAVGQGDHTQVLAQLHDPDPMTDAAVLGLYFPAQRLAQGQLHPLLFDVGPLGHDIVAEVVGRFHVAYLPQLSLSPVTRLNTGLPFA